jgi:hypothetical protein
VASHAGRKIQATTSKSNYYYCTKKMTRTLFPIESFNMHDVETNPPSGFYSMHSSQGMNGKIVHFKNSKTLCN